MTTYTTMICPICHQMMSREKQPPLKRGKKTLSVLRYRYVCENEKCNKK